jgi:hypothetical protein
VVSSVGKSLSLIVPVDPVSASGVSAAPEFTVPALGAGVSRAGVLAGATGSESFRPEGSAVLDKLSSAARLRAGGATSASVSEFTEESSSEFTAESSSEFTAEEPGSELVAVVVALSSADPPAPERVSDSLDLVLTADEADASAELSPREPFDPVVSANAIGSETIPEPTPSAMARAPTRPT